MIRNRHNQTPHPAPKTKRETTKHTNWRQFTKGTRLLLPVFFAFAWVLFFLRIFLLISGVIHGIEATDLLVLDGICLSAESWMKEVNKSKFSCTERVFEWPLKYFSFANSSVSFFIDSCSPFWYRYTFLRGFFIGRKKISRFQRQCHDH